MKTILTTSNIQAFISKDVRFSVSAYEGNADYTGVAHIEGYDELSRKIYVKAISGDNLGFAFVDYDGEHFAYSDADRWIEIEEVSFDWEGDEAAVESSDWQELVEDGETAPSLSCTYIGRWEQIRSEIVRIEGKYSCFLDSKEYNTHVDGPIVKDGFESIEAAKVCAEKWMLENLPE